MKQYKMKTGPKIVLLVLIVILAAFGVFKGVQSGKVTLPGGSNKSTPVEADADGNVINTAKSSADTINLSIDEWIGQI